MTIIEGIGDEVIQFFGVVIIGILGLIAWWSTNISDLPQIRTVLVLQRRSQDTQNTDTPPQTGEVPTGGSIRKIVRSGITEETNIQEPETETATEANETLNIEETLNSDSIKIRLKYLNDDQKLVDANLQEMLGEFKRRNFEVELARQQRVRLIFNGQVLSRDNNTLASCGLYDNCVVHCIVHTQPTTQNNQTPGQAGANQATPPDWNLGGLLYALLSMIFGMAWVFWYNYSHLFNVITTISLIGLTVMFAGSLIGAYVPD